MAVRVPDHLVDDVRPVGDGDELLIALVVEIVDEHLHRSVLAQSEEPVADGEAAVEVELKLVVSERRGVDPARRTVESAVPLVEVAVGLVVDEDHGPVRGAGHEVDRTRDADGRIEDDRLRPDDLDLAETGLSGLDLLRDVLRRGEHLALLVSHRLVLVLASRERGLVDRVDAGSEFGRIGAVVLPELLDLGVGHVRILLGTRPRVHPADGLVRIERLREHRDERRARRVVYAPVPALRPVEVPVLVELDRDAAVRERLRRLGGVALPVLADRREHLRERILEVRRAELADGRHRALLERLLRRAVGFVEALDGGGSRGFPGLHDRPGKHHVEEDVPRGDAVVGSVHRHVNGGLVVRESVGKDDAGDGVEDPLKDAEDLLEDALRRLRVGLDGLRVVPGTGRELPEGVGEGLLVEPRTGIVRLLALRAEGPAELLAVGLADGAHRDEHRHRGVEVLVVHRLLDLRILLTGVDADAGAERTETVRVHAPRRVVTGESGSALAKRRRREPVGERETDVVRDRHEAVDGETAERGFAPLHDGEKRAERRGVVEVDHHRVPVGIRAGRRSPVAELHAHHRTDGVTGLRGELVADDVAFDDDRVPLHADRRVRPLRLERLERVLEVRGELAGLGL